MYISRMRLAESLRDSGDVRSSREEAGPSGTSGSAPDSTARVRRFPLAAQPEIMRAAEKDDQYASFVYEACRDAFRQLFGGFAHMLALLLIMSALCYLDLIFFYFFG